MAAGAVSSGRSGRGGGGGTGAPFYDRLATVFCPEGRLYQVDYAWNAVRLAGVTSVGVRGADSVCVVGQRKPKDMLLDAASVSRLFPITERLGLLTMGITGIAQITQHVSKRPSGVVAMILGIDDEKETPELFTCDPAGYFLGHKAASAGHRDREAINFLEKKMNNNPSLSFQETVQMAISVLQYALKEDLKATEIHVGVVRKDDPIFRMLTASEIEEHLKAIRPRKQS